MSQAARAYLDMKARAEKAEREVGRLESERDILFKGDWAALNLRAEMAEREVEELRGALRQLQFLAVNGQDRHSDPIEALCEIESRAREALSKTREGR